MDAKGEQELIENAIQINSFDGENNYLEMIHGDNFTIKFRLSWIIDNKIYSRIGIILEDGRKENYCFDITASLPERD